MKKTVVFYSDRPIKRENLPIGTRTAIMKHLGAEDHFLVSANVTRGFESGIHWDYLSSEKGVIAVVLVDVNDACAVGVALEAECMDVYELFAGQLLKLKNLVVAKKETVLVLHQPNPATDDAVTATT